MASFDTRFLLPTNTPIHARNDGSYFLLSICFAVSLSFLVSIPASACLTELLSLSQFHDSSQSIEQSDLKKVYLSFFIFGSINQNNQSLVCDLRIRWMKQINNARKNQRKSPFFLVSHTLIIFPKCDNTLLFPVYFILYTQYSFGYLLFNCKPCITVFSESRK